MGLLIQPSLIGISGKQNKNKHSVSFIFDWTTQADNTTPSVPIGQNFGGVTFSGLSYTLDVSSLHSNVADLPSFSTLVFSQTFDVGSTDVLDGELLVSVSGVGQIMRFAQPEVSVAPSKAVICCCVPIAANSPTKITFAKGADTGGAMFGTLTASIYDFDMSPFISNGSFNGN